MSTTLLPNRALIEWIQFMRNHHDIVRTANALHELGAMSAQQHYLTVNTAQDAIRLCHMTAEQTVPFTSWDSEYVGFLQTAHPNRLRRGIITECEYWDEFFRFVVEVTL